MPPLKDLTGKRFGMLTVVRRISPKGEKHIKWECVCECGVITKTAATHLVGGDTTSCGCFQRNDLSARRSKHGESNKTAEYAVWSGMLKRCRDSSDKNYGGRGVTVSDEWSDYSVFLSDMGRRPTPKHEIERIDNNKGYSKENCKWATRVEQAQNKRSNRIIAHEGKKLSMAEWERIKGMNPGRLSARLNKLGWSVEKALTEPRHNTGGRYPKCLVG